MCVGGGGGEFKYPESRLTNVNILTYAPLGGGGGFKYPESRLTNVNILTYAPMPYFRTQVVTE